MQVQQGESWQQLLLRINAKLCELSMAGKEFTDDHVSRAILRSQPPHAAQVPAMVQFVSLFGGGDSGVFVKDVVNFCAVAQVDVQTHVSGRHFKALAGLAADFDVTEIPALAVNAILKRLASSKNVTDGVSSHYTTGEITGLTSRKMRPKLLEADSIMRRCRTILTDQEVKELERTRLEGYLQTALMDCILEKTNEDGERIEKLERVTEIFLRKVLRGHDPQPALGPAAPAREQGPEGEQGPHADGVIQYDADGQAVALPRAVLLQKGFAAGKMYYKGKDQ